MQSMVKLACLAAAGLIGMVGCASVQPGPGGMSTEPPSPAPRSQI